MTFFVIKRNLKEGIADKQGKIKVPTEYTNISFGGIYVNADKDGQFVLLDLNGKVIENQDIVTKLPTKDGKHYIVADKNEMYDITDLNGRKHDRK